MTEPLLALVLGAGAAGLHCAASASRAGRVMVIDHAAAPGEKIRISGGGRCNFTNLNTRPDRFLSANPHFAKSALARYTPADFVALVNRHRIAFHEKTLGQLFCDGSARQIVAMLLAEAAAADLRLGTSAEEIRRTPEGYSVRLSDGTQVTARNLVVATGGKSIPKMGATGFGYRVAEQFGLPLTETRPGLVPLTFDPATLDRFRPLAGVALPVRASAGKASFDEALLFTHRGLSGPAILQISSYWHEGAAIGLDLLPGQDAFARLKALKAEAGRRAAGTMLAQVLPARLAADLAQAEGLTANMADLSDARLRALAATLAGWTLKPTGTEGYRTAEVTLGGVSTAALDARTMEARGVPGLFFVGEVVDVTGWLGGYNFQWAWASAHAAGTEIAART
jgi:predicted Rossmann fold flavoprotein